MSPVIDRVRALLAKAESTTYPAEADALLAKAQELITRHAIDAALLGPNAYDEVGHEEIALHGSYSAERAQLWNAVAAANRLPDVDGASRRRVDAEPYRRQFFRLALSGHPRPQHLDQRVLVEGLDIVRIRLLG